MKNRKDNNKKNRLRNQDFDLEDIIQNEIVENRIFEQWRECGEYVEDESHKQRIWRRLKKKQSAILYNTMYKKIGLKVALVLLVSMVGFISFKMGEKSFSESNYITKNYVEVFSGGALHYVLPDSSVVWMRSNSTLRYDKDFTQNREVYLEGSSVFDVTKKSGQEFKVHLKNSTIRVLGTSFAVSDYPDLPSSEVLLYNGVVEFEVIGETDKYIMAPGEKLVYNEINNEIVLDYVDNLKWDNGVMFFENMKLSKFIEIVSDIYRVDLLVDKDVNLLQQITGTIGYEQSLAEILYKVCYALNITCKADGPNRYKISP